MSSLNEIHFTFIFLLQNIFLSLTSIGLSSTLYLPLWMESPRLCSSLASPGPGRRLVEGEWETHSIFIPSFPSLQSAGQLWPCFSIKIFFSATVATSLSGFSNFFVPSGLELLMLVMPPLLLVPALGELPHLVSIFHNIANLLPHLGTACPSFLTNTKMMTTFLLIFIFWSRVSLIVECVKQYWLFGYLDWLATCFHRFAQSLKSPSWLTK